MYLLGIDTCGPSGSVALGRLTGMHAAETVAHGDRRLAEAARFGLPPVIEPESHKSLRAALGAAMTPAGQVAHAA